jgi:hypothetical protein
LTVDVTWVAGKPTLAVLRPTVSGRRRIRLAAGVTIASIHSGDLVVRFREHADGAELQLEAGRRYDVRFR